MKALSTRGTARRWRLRQLISTAACIMVWALSFGQISPSVPATTANHTKQVIGYITQWDAWKELSGIVPKGGYNHLNIDYSQYTMLNFSFFGVAKDGSLHSGDFRNKNIYQVGAVQEPAALVNSDIYSSWDMYLLYGELETVYYVTDGSNAYNQGYRNEGSGWKNVNTGATGAFPLSVHLAGGAPGIIELAHSKGVKVMASVGGWSMCKHYPEVAASSTMRATFINSCKQLIAMGFDGIDFDWEYPNDPGMNIEHYSAADYNNFATLAEELRAAIGTSKLITACFSAVPSKLTGFNWTRLSNVLNYIDMMTYDYNGGWSNKAGHNAPLYDYPNQEYANFSINATVQGLKALSGINMSKVTIGAPFYGRGVITSSAAALNGATTKRAETVQPDGPVQTCADFSNWGYFDGTPNYSYIVQQTGSGSGWTEYWDDVAKVPYKTKGNYFLSYDNERSVGEKAQYIKDQGLAGVIVWQVYGDLTNMTSSTVAKGKLIYCPNTTSPLVNKINQVFASGSTGNVAPSVSLTAPTNNASYTAPATVTITATATDTDGSIAKVEFYNGATLLSTVTASPYTYSWTSVAAGTYSITAKATDNSGASTTSSASSITVTASSGNKAPTVSLTAPTSGSSYTAPASVTLTATATDSDGTISKVEFYNGATLLSTVTTSPYTYTWSNVSAGTYSLTAKATDNSGASTTSSASSITVTTGSGNTSGKVIVGYWHNWGSTTGTPPYIRLRDVNPKYNVIQVAFGESLDYSTVTFTPEGTTSADFISDIATLQSQGRKVLLSLGGQNGTLVLSTATAKANFITSMKNILDTYNFDGFDIDLEGGTTLQMDNGDNNFTAPTTAKVVNLIAAVKEIISYRTAKGKNCWLTMAPETYYVQTAYSATYSPLVGAYLPLIYGLKDQLTFIHPQLYNTGSVNGLDNKVYYQSTADFIVAMTEMLLKGFPVAGTSLTFPALREDQVAFGLPANSSAAPSGGYLAPANVKQALNYLTKGTSFGGAYTLQKSGGYPGLRGIMTWSINWDKSNGDEFATNYYDYFFGSTGTNNPPSVSITSPANNATFSAGATVSIAASASDADGSVSKVEFYNGSTLLGTSTASPYTYSWSNVAAGTYYLTAKATDNGGAVSTSSTVTIVVGGGTGTGCSGIAAWSASAVYLGGAQVVYNNKIYQAKWWTQNEQPDTHTGDGQVWAYVSDCSGGNTGTGSSPVVTLTAPAANATYTAPASVTITATATDADGTISKVEFYNGATLLSTSTASPYTYAWGSVAAGSYSITAKATDNSGNVTTSSAVSITVTGSSSTGNCAGVAAYQPYPAVYNLGDKVTYNGYLYESLSNALYNVTPGTADYWWKPLGACTSSALVSQATVATDIASSVSGASVVPNPTTANTVQVLKYAEAGDRLSIVVQSANGYGAIRKDYTAGTTGVNAIPLETGRLAKGVWIVYITNKKTGAVSTTRLVKL